MGVPVTLSSATDVAVLPQAPVTSCDRDVVVRAVPLALVSWSAHTALFVLPSRRLR
ncbi:hypothetical protein [Asanoa iriomotensis]|uniref:hypothetical protein n=1 Tax=Asanoa iriomotensis TaxID=234613 RepID=UPI0019436B6F|nr:hypothetical protein [Asanoa iriomotensis]